MILTIEEWLDMSEKKVTICDGQKPNIPKVIFIGTRRGNHIESHMRLVSDSVWEEFEAVWKKMSGTNSIDDKGKMPRSVPQFFLIN